MRLRAGVSIRSVFLTLMVVSVATSLLGPQVAAALRGPALIVLAPLGDG